MRILSASIALSFSLLACSGRFEGVDDGAAATADDAGAEAATGCSAIQGCGSGSGSGGGSSTPPGPTGNPNPSPPNPSPTDASAPPPSPSPTPAPAPSPDASSPPPNPPGCPSSPPPAGDICKVHGTSCTWVYNGCDTTQCDCEALGNGPASWQCSGTYTCFDAGTK